MAAYTSESITVADTAIGFTVAKIDLSTSLYGRSVQRVLVTVEVAPIRFKIDGTAPTSTVGHLLDVGDVFICDGADVRKFLAIRTGSTSGVMQCTYQV